MKKKKGAKTRQKDHRLRQELLESHKITSFSYLGNHSLDPPVREN